MLPFFLAPLALLGAAHGFERVVDAVDGIGLSALRGERGRLGSAIACDVCEAVFDVVDRYVADNSTAPIEAGVTRICEDVLPLVKLSKEMCPGLVQTYTPPLLFIFVRLELNPHAICERLRYCTADDGAPPPRRRRAAVPTADSRAGTGSAAAAKEAEGARGAPAGMVGGGAPAVRAPAAREKAPHGTVHGRRVPVGSGAGASSASGAGEHAPLRILQISDMHYDVDYAPGSRTDCGKLICCRPWDGVGTAGVWGDYACDLPLVTVKRMMEQLGAMSPPPDLILWTGDNPPHDLWNQTKASQMNATQSMTDLVRATFPNTPVFPLIGNHDSYAANLFYRPTFGWMTDDLADMWSTWLDAGALETMRYGGYYTMLVRPGLRVVAINTQYGYQENFYFLLNDADPGEQNAWLDAVLSAARLTKERVILIGHVPPGHIDAIPWYGRTYTALAEKFADVLIGQFFGHVHRDQFEVVRASDDGFEGDPVGVVHISPSVTTFTNQNPAYRVYHAEYDAADGGYRVVDYDQYYMNMTEANGIGSGVSPVWRKEYSAREAYGLADFSPAAWWNLTEQFRVGADVVTQYRRFESASALDDGGECARSLHCVHELQCELRSATVTAFVKCNSLLLADGAVSGSEAGSGSGISEV